MACHICSTKDAPIRRWLNNSNGAAGDIGFTLEGWCHSYLCALVRPFMESGLHDAALSRDALALLKSGAAREPWRYTPEEAYFDASRGHTRRDVDVVQLLHAFFRPRGALAAR